MTADLRQKYFQRKKHLEKCVKKAPLWVSGAIPQSPLPGRKSDSEGEEALA